MPDSTSHDPDRAARELRVAARALARAGLVHAYGHVSVRVGDGEFLVSPPKPLGLVSVGEPAVRVLTVGPLPPGALPEVIVHQQIYRRRPEVGAVVRFQSPQVMALSALGATPRALHGFGAYFAPCPPLYGNPRLVRDAAGAAALVEQLADARAIVMRGNGAVTVGAGIAEAVALAWYLEDAARVDLAVRSSGADGLEYTAAEVRDRAITAGRLFERMWDFLSAHDPELATAIGGIGQ
jgi:HCOMODA/2-hydroxy-3-carboxy-muconic semialdehyde decarboxylase